MDFTQLIPVGLYVIGALSAITSILFMFWVDKMIVEPLKQQAEEIKEIQAQLFNIWKEKADGVETKTRLKELESRIYELAQK